MFINIGHEADMDQTVKSQKVLGRIQKGGGRGGGDRGPDLFWEFLDPRMSSIFVCF